LADATSNLVRWATPASAAALRASAIEASWLSMPRKVDRPNACAMMMVEAPSPHPTSATLAPARSLSATPSSAGSHALTRLAA
jgi:hypothetical protein